MNTADLKTKKIAEYLYDTEAVCENDTYIQNAYALGMKTTNPDYVPMHFIDNADCSVFDGMSITLLEIMYLYERSRSMNTFRLGDKYVYFDQADNLLYSSDRPYHEGTYAYHQKKIDASEIAAFCVEHDDDLDNDTIREILDMVDVNGLTQEQMTMLNKGRKAFNQINNLPDNSEAHPQGGHPLSSIIGSDYMNA